MDVYHRENDICRIESVVELTPSKSGCRRCKRSTGETFSVVTVDGCCCDVARMEAPVSDRRREEVCCVRPAPRRRADITGALGASRVGSGDIGEL